MARLAVYVDGGYVDALASMLDLRFDMQKLTDRILHTVQQHTPGSIELLRTFYYHCLPYQSNPPTATERQRFANKRKFFDSLRRLPRFSVREGRLAFRGYDRDGKPIFQQKRTDLLLGLDFALLSGKRTITHAAVVSGDSDLVPAFKVVREEGILVWLFHGPRVSPVTGQATYAEELWLEADERCEIDATFARAVSR